MIIAQFEHTSTVDRIHRRVVLKESDESGMFFVVTQQDAKQIVCAPWEQRDGWRDTMWTNHFSEYDAVTEYNNRVKLLKERGF